MKILLQLFFTFVKIGLFTFGGGYSMISIIDEACVKKKKWITDDEMTNIVVVAESTPGPIAVNAATYVGFKQAGAAGALAATAGITLPSFLIIYLISAYFKRFLEIAVISNALKGIKIAAGLLILKAGINILKRTPKEAAPASLAAFGLVASLVISAAGLKISSIALIIVAAAVSLVIFAVKRRKRK